jgi:hypothetical protein
VYEILDNVKYGGRVSYSVKELICWRAHTISLGVGFMLIEINLTCYRLEMKN